MKVIVDRIEGDFLVCEKKDKTMMDIKKSIAPEGVKPGDILNIEKDKITINKNETRKRKKIIDDIMKDIWN